MFRKTLGTAATAALFLLLPAAPPARAGGPYCEFTACPYVDPYGGFLDGAAAVIDAQGRFLMDHQQACLRQQQVERARLDTQRRQLDLWLWKRDHLPTPADDQEQARREQVRQAQVNPPVTEVLSGKALNDLLLDCQVLQGRGAVGPDVRLDEASLRRVNVTSGASAGGAGLLRSSRLDWPPLLTQDRFREDRARVEALLAEAAGQAAPGPVPARTLRDLDDAVRQLQGKVKALARTTSDEDMRPSQFVRADRFLGQLRDAARLLQEPDAGGYLTGKYAAEGRTVAELVQSMTRQGLRFAPAAGGNEAGYLALHRALAAYDAGLHAAAGVRLPDRSGPAAAGR